MAKRTNTKATISGTSTGSVTETGIGVSDVTTISGVLSVTDPDPGENLFKTPMSSSLTGLYGSFTFNPLSGIWTYLLDNSRTATNALYGGQVVTDKLTVTSYDGTATRDILVTITGTNDAPTLTAGKASATLIEQGGRVKAVSTATITMSKADPDTGDTTSWVMTGWTLASGTQYTKAGVYGNARFDTSTGVVSYTLDNSKPATDALRGSENASDGFALTVRDAAGATATQNAVFAITGSNDAPVAVSDTLSATQGTAVTYTAAQLLANDIDVDTPAANLKIASVSSASGGTVTLNATAQTVTFTPAPGFSGTASFSYAISDGALTSAAVADHVNVMAADTTPPAAPTVTLAFDTGASATDAITANASLNVGNVESGATVTFRAGSSTAWTSSAPAPVEGANTVYVRQTDAAGNVSPSSSISFTYDSIAPVLQSAVVDGSTLTLTYADAGSLDAANPPPASAFAVSAAGSALDVRGVSVNGAAGSVTLTLSAAVRFGDDVTVSYTDPGAGNDAHAVQDIAGNDAATIAAVAVNNITRDTTPPVITGPSGGAGAAAAVVSVPENSTAVWTFSSDDNQTTWYISEGADLSRFHMNVITGVLSFTSAPDFEHPADVGANNVYEVVVTAADQAGNVSTQSLSVTVTNVDDTPVPSAIAVITGMSKDSGASGSDFITNDGSAGRTVNGSLTGALGPDEVVQVSFNNGVDWSNALVTGSTWTATDSGSHDANWTIQARVFNAFGPVFSTPGVQVVTLDQTAPAAPSVVLANDTGASASDLNTADATLSPGNPEAGAMLAYAASASGPWTPSPPTPSPGANTVYMHQTDIAGNESPASSISFTYDIIGPTILQDGAVNGSTLFLQVSDTSHLDTVNLPDTSAFTVNVNGSPRWVTSVAVDGDNAVVTLGLSTPVTFTDTVSVSYDDPSSSNDPFALQDLAGNDAASHTTIAVTNLTPDGEAPVITGPAGSPGDATVHMSIPENSTGIGTFSANETAGWELYPSADKDLFSFDPDTRTLSFASAPDFESPADADHDNVYEVIIAATDNPGNTAYQTVLVTVTDVNENPVLAPTETVAITGMDHDTGISASDFLTFDGSPRNVSGTLSSDLTVGEEVQVSFDDGSHWTSAITTGSAWTATDDNTHTASWTVRARVHQSTGDLYGTETSQFVTLDQTAPTFALNSATTAVAVGNDIVLSFSEDVVPPSGTSTGTITISNGSDDIRNIPVIDARVTFAGSAVIINPTANLHTDSTYVISFAPGTFFDNAGNDAGGTASDSPLQLTTQTLADFYRDGLNGTNGFFIMGGAQGDHIGYAVSRAGDINGDGYGDLLIGESVSGSTAGAAYLIFGKPSGFAGSIDLDTMDSTTGIRLSGPNGSFTGKSVSAAGDINHDGLADLLVGAGNLNGGAGGAFVIYGQSTWPGDAGNIDLASLSSSTPAMGSLLSGTGSDHAGFSVSSIGDFNSDGIDDLVLGTFGASSSAKRGPGYFSTSTAAYVVFGSNGGPGNLTLTSLDGSNGFTILDNHFSNVAGYTVSGAGDLNGDGRADLVIATPQLNAGDGVTYVVFGMSNPQGFKLADPSTWTGITLLGNIGGSVGSSVSLCGDVNGDQFDDLIIGAPTADSDAGAAYLLYGAAGFDSAITLSDQDDIRFTRFLGAGGSNAGLSVSSAGDLNGDGFADLLIGAPSASTNGLTGNGATYVVFGKEGGLGTTVSLADLHYPDGFLLQGVMPGIRYGSAVSGAGDINGDGYDDLVIGAPLADPQSGSDGITDSGAVYVLFGSAAIGNTLLL